MQTLALMYVKNGIDFVYKCLWGVGKLTNFAPRNRKVSKDSIRLHKKIDIFLICFSRLVFK